MSRSLSLTFLTHAVVALLFGAPLLLFPGRLLDLLGWAPVDPLISRILGAALLALAWSSFRAWQAADIRQAAVLVETEIVFTVLACSGLLRHLLKANYPAMVWLVFAGLAVFAVAWIVAWWREVRPMRGGS